MATSRITLDWRTIHLLTAVALCSVLIVNVARGAEQTDQSNLPEWGGGWTHVNPIGDGQAMMWQTFTPAYSNLTSVEIDILTANPGGGDDVLTVEIARGGDVLVSAVRSVKDGFDGLLRFEFPEAENTNTRSKRHRRQWRTWDKSSDPDRLQEAGKSGCSFLMQTDRLPAETCRGLVGMTYPPAWTSFSKRGSLRIGSQTGSRRSLATDSSDGIFSSRRSSMPMASLCLPNMT